jgi:hypothetical protein
MKMAFWNKQTAAEPVEEKKSSAAMMITTRRFPLYYMAITKCGSTFLKNLIYHLDNDALHPDADNIHKYPKLFSRARYVPEADIAASSHAFTVIRDPVDRYLSLYFDKILVGDGSEVWDLLAEELQLERQPGLDAAGHLRNCEKIIPWLEDNLAYNNDFPINHHWKRQSNRLTRVQKLNLEHLTLKGINTQLTYFLRDLVPDIEERLHAVGSRNRSKKPFGRADVLSPALEAEIRRIYQADHEAYLEAVEDWALRLSSESAPQADRLRVLTTRRHPIQTIVIPKAGCTFQRNLFYYLDHQKLHEDPLAIQRENCLVKADLRKEDMERTGFIVLRNPIDRFFSLYFDKAFGTGPQAFPWIAEKIRKERGAFHQGPDTTLEQHQSNCRRLLGFLETRFRNEGPERVNVHSRPQFHIAGRAIEFGLQPILLDQLDTQLPALLGKRIPELAEAMKAVRPQNKSPKPVSPEKIRSPRMVNRILALYGDDMTLYRAVAKAWRKTGSPPRF